MRTFDVLTGQISTTNPMHIAVVIVIYIARVHRQMETAYHLARREPEQSPSADSGNDEVSADVKGMDLKWRESSS